MSCIILLVSFDGLMNSDEFVQPFCVKKEAICWTNLCSSFSFLSEIDVFVLAAALAASSHSNVSEVAAG